MQPRVESQACLDPAFVLNLWLPGSRQRCIQPVAARAAADLRQVLEDLASQTDLTEERTRDSLEALLEGAQASTSGDVAQPGGAYFAQMAAFLVLLRAKGETPEEIAGLAKAMKAKMRRVRTQSDVLDIVGTGGDGIGSVNISTGACVVAAAAGAKVAKHGNRSVSSLCGSADVIEALGIVVDMDAENVAQCIEDVGVGFMFAPRYHPAMKAVVPVRKALKIRTAFNILGPLLNPAEASYGLIGVYSTSISQLMASTLQRLDVRKALVVHSMGLDELTPLGDAEIVEVVPSGTRTYRIDPTKFGIPRCTVEDLKGGDATLNATILRDVFGGQKGAVADALCLNAGVALAACDVAKDAAEGIAMAQEAQRSGRAGQVLDKWVAFSQQTVNIRQPAPV
ncbi:hypothetical protein WJX72_000598 [[Myrmecia] bisecta]|uniref:anthranilate phosphoribosyltransferase n=1 Tax=[Myrmecia] bisecta TaxID=41462 RepID=A0AAW1PB28_9CHLO